MALKIVLALAGLLLAAGGGYLAWTHQGAAASLFPPPPGYEPWLFVGGIWAALAGVACLGLALFTGAEKPAPKSKSAKAGKPTPRSASKSSSKSSSKSGAPPKTSYNDMFSDLPPTEGGPAPDRPAERDWRSSEIKAPPPAPAPAPAPEPQPQPIAAAPITAPTPAPAPQLAAAPASTNFADVRAALSENRLDDADKLLNSHRQRLGEGGQPLAMAELTGLAGDHAAAAGRIGGAKWLWRLSLQRFAEAGAISDPAARAVSERLRLADQ